MVVELRPLRLPDRRDRGINIAKIRLRTARAAPWESPRTGDNIRATTKSVAPDMKIKGRAPWHEPASASRGEPAQVPDRRCGGRRRNRGIAAAERRRCGDDLAGRSEPAEAIRAAAVGAAGGGRDRNAAGAGARQSSGRIRFHGRRHQDARHRVPAVEFRLELPRPARVADQLRRATRSPSSSPARTRNARWRWGTAISRSPASR